MEFALGFIAGIVVGGLLLIALCLAVAQEDDR